MIKKTLAVFILLISVFNFAQRTCGTTQVMEEFYKNIGDTLKKNYPGTNAWFITANLDALKFVGLKPSRKIKLFNASLEARLVKYEMYEGSKRTKFQTENKE